MNGSVETFASGTAVSFAPGSKTVKGSEGTVRLMFQSSGMGLRRDAEAYRARGLLGMERRAESEGWRLNDLSVTRSRTAGKGAPEPGAGRPGRRGTNTLFS